MRALRSAVSEIDATGSRSRGHYRWVICGLLFAATVVNYTDRQVLGILADTLQEQIGWSEQDYGFVVAAFSTAYAIALAVWGAIIDRGGIRLGYAMAVALWSLAAMAHALAGSAFGFGLARFGLGLSEAGNFPAAIKTVAEWFPRRERALAVGLFNAGTNVGAILAPLLVPWLALTWGWQSAFLVTGAMGFFWLVLWLWLYAPPARHPRVSAGELAYIQQDPAEDAFKVPWRSLFRCRQTWAFFLAKAITDPVWWFYLFWLPPYLYDARDFDLKQIGWALPVVYLMADFGSVGGGWISGYLIRRGWSNLNPRRAAIALCAAGMPVAACAVFAPGPVLTIALVSIATAAHQGWSANLYTITSDVFPSQAVASVTGIGGCAGGLGGFLFSSILPGFIVAYFGYVPMFVLMGVLHLAALFLMHYFIWWPARDSAR